jgi:hypothetical protein
MEEEEDGFLPTFIPNRYPRLGHIPQFTSFLYYLPHITWLFIICHTLD